MMMFGEGICHQLFIHVVLHCGHSFVAPELSISSSLLFIKILKFYVFGAELGLKTILTMPAVEIPTYSLLRLKMTKRGGA